MRFRTKLAILVVAVILSLAGYGVIANALSVNHIMSAATPSTEIGVTITG